MRNLFTLLMASLLTVGLYGQRANRLIQNPEQVRSQALQQIDESQLMDQPIPVISNTSTPTVPLGTITSDAVTSIKIGEASNAYTSLLLESTQLSVESGAGSNGGTVAFVHRQNVGACGGSTGENGVYRYSFSTDGGQSWNVGSGTNTGGNPPVTGCYGLGPLNPGYLQASRYPSAHVFLAPDSTKIENLGLVYSGPVLNPSGQGWDGSVIGYADSIAFTPVVRQEFYPFSNADHYFSYSLVERVPGEFFFLSYTWDGAAILGDIHINRGIWNASSGEIDWSVVTTLAPDYFLGFDGSATFASMAIGFSPDGMTGYVGAIGDLIGGTDSTFQVAFSKSADGGQTWGNMEEFDMAANTELMDSLHFFIDIDTTTGDTVFAGGDHPTTAFDCDMVVDKNGAPHLITLVGHGTSHNGDGTYADPGYSIFPGLEMFILDFTFDTFGDLNMLYIAYQEYLRGTFGNTSVDPAGEFTADPYVQASRSEDGSVVMFSWTDSDPANVTGENNDAPDLFTVAYDVDMNMMTPVTNWTSDDGVWASTVITPHAAPTLVTNGTVHSMPIKAMQLDLGDGIQTVSFWYFSDVSVDQSSDFTETPHFFYNCKQNPFTNSASIISPDCGVSDGEVAVVPGGGIGPYTYQWGANAGSSTNDTVTALPAGIYEVIVTDTKACKDTLSVLVNNANAPTLAISAVADISCNGLTDGTATVTPTGGAGGEAYLWSNGETTATATSLPPGTSTVTVTDANGCSSFESVTLSEPTAITATATSIDVLCNGDLTGEAMADAAGGTGTLTYAWDNGDMGATISNVLAGTYTVTVTDANGCTTTASTTISEPPAIANTMLPFPNTGGMPATYNGNVVADASGGVGPYTYSWTGPDGYDTTGVNLDFITRLCGGTYFVEITDQNGCVFNDSAVVTTLGLGVNCPEDTTIIDGIFGPVSAGVNEISVFPNPTNGSFVLNVELESREDLVMEVFNFRGQLVARNTAEGVLSHEERFDISGEAAGIYMVKITTSLGSVTEKVMLR